MNRKSTSVIKTLNVKNSFPYNKYKYTYDNWFKLKNKCILKSFNESKNPTWNFKNKSLINSFMKED